MDALCFHTVFAMLFVSLKVVLLRVKRAATSQIFTSFIFSIWFLMSELRIKVPFIWQMTYTSSSDSLCIFLQKEVFCICTFQKVLYILSICESQGKA